MDFYYSPCTTKTVYLTDMLRWWSWGVGGHFNSFLVLFIKNFFIYIRGNIYCFYFFIVKFCNIENGACHRSSVCSICWRILQACVDRKEKKQRFVKSIENVHLTWSRCGRSKAPYQGLLYLRSNHPNTSAFKWYRKIPIRSLSIYFAVNKKPTVSGWS